MSAVGLYYYLLILKAAFVAPTPAQAKPISVHPATAIALVIAAGLIIILGLAPSTLLLLVS